jgi:hypothetical protein
MRTLRIAACGITDRSAPIRFVIRFNDRAADERFIGWWSQLGGETFIGWHESRQPGKFRSL